MTNVKIERNSTFTLINVLDSKSLTMKTYTDILMTNVFMILQ